MGVNVFTIQTEYTAQRNTDKSSNFDGGVLNLHHDNDVKEVVLSQTGTPCTNQPIKESEFIQCES